MHSVCVHSVTLAPCVVGSMNGWSCVAECFVVVLQGVAYFGVWRVCSLVYSATCNNTACLQRYSVSVCYGPPPIAIMSSNSYFNNHAIKEWGIVVY